MKHDVTIQTIFTNHTLDHHRVVVDADTGNEAALVGRADFIDGEFYQRHRAHIARVYVVGVTPSRSRPSDAEIEEGAAILEDWLADRHANPPAADVVKAEAKTIKFPVKRRPAPKKRSPSPKRAKAVAKPSVALNTVVAEREDDAEPPRTELDGN